MLREIQQSNLTLKDHSLIRTTSFFTLRIVRQLFTTALLLITAQLATLAQSPPSDFDSVVAAAAAARSQGDTARAIDLYTKAEDARPSWPDGWWYLGTLEYGADRYEAARNALNHFIELTPNATAAIALRGLCEFEIGQYVESLQDLQHGIALGAANQPRNAQILLYHEALALTRVGRFDEALGKYLFFVKKASPNPELALAVGLAGLRMPLLPREVDPAKSELVAAVGTAAIAVMTGDMAGGQQDFQEVFSRYPGTLYVHYLYGYLLYGLHSDQAVPEFQQELALAPQSAITHAMLAWVLETQDDFEHALPNAKDAAAEDASLPLSQLVYGRALVETGSVDEGLSHIQDLLRTEPGNLEAHMTLAKAYSKLGRSEDARKERLLCMQLSDQEVFPLATP
jgi:tetratricopeptide (TPR) repeat protein